jgi:integrase
MRNKKSKGDDLHKSLNEFLRLHNKTRRGGSVASHATSSARRKIILQCLKQLKILDYYLTSIYQLKERHVIALAKFWEIRKLSPATIQTRMSVLRVLCNERLKKPGMIQGTECYFSSNFNIKRSSIATVDKSWEAMDINFESTLNIVHGYDPFVALCLEFMRAFGLRKKEAIMFQPHLSYAGILIYISKGSKNGRKRMVSVLTEKQLDLIMKARKITQPSESLADPNRTLKQAMRHFDYIMFKACITKKALGITSHGLRHGNGQNDYFDITGELVPLKNNSKIVNKGIDKQARQEIAEKLGHSRVSVTNFYFGKK